MLKTAGLCLVFILMSTLSPAQKTGDSISISPDQKEFSLGKARIPDRAYFSKYLNDKQYRYEEDYPAEVKSNFLSRLWHRILTLRDLLFKALAYFPLTVRIIFYCLFVLLLVILATTRFSKIFYTETVTAGSDFMEIQDEGGQTDLDAAVRIQISRQNYRSAIRFLHLKILKELELKGLVTFSREKTNRDYSREIKDSRHQAIFSQLAAVYNRIWFGNYDLTSEEFDKLASGFYRFSDLLSGREE
jgi:hypothetical protein